MEIFAAVIAFLAAGAVCLLFWALLFELVVEDIEGLLRLPYMFILTIISIPAFLLNRRDLWTIGV